MSTSTTAPKTVEGIADFHWECQPEAGALIAELLHSFRNDCPAIEAFARAALERTGTRLLDWVDHFELPNGDEIAKRLTAVGFVPTLTGKVAVFANPLGLFPSVELYEQNRRCLAIKVDSVVEFLAAQGLLETARIEGSPGTSIRRAKIAVIGDVEFDAIERHGDRSLAGITLSPEHAVAAQRHFEAFRLRPRPLDDEPAGFAAALSLIEAAKHDLGQNRTCHLFFEGERRYWQSRNRAARVQKARQDALGLGWANHDHHTYRSSRSHFPALIAVFERLGFHCRERFYAGPEAGWGAQVLEHPQTGIVIFADVDMSPEELLGDFSHNPLPPRDELGTVGLWCRLHGEAFLNAGMHHLEAQFDFDAACSQLACEGVKSMKPFTNFSFLRQCFTEGEVWPVCSKQIDSLLAEELISRDQAEQFRSVGAVGSHLEILERNDGYKGFNQTGVNEIIRDTDPRRLVRELVGV